MSTGPAFRTGEIRPHMDVFTLDGERLGMVIRVIPGEELPEVERVTTRALQRSEIDGEQLGPAPTRDVGNTGPTVQSPDNQYGTNALHGDSLGNGSMVIATLLGMFGRRTIPLDEVQTVSMERVVLRHPASHYE
jgi:hypothetical protein